MLFVLVCVFVTDSVTGCIIFLFTVYDMSGHHMLFVLLCVFVTNSVIGCIIFLFTVYDMSGHHMLFVLVCVFVTDCHRMHHFPFYSL